ncbi:MAG TPA: DNA polymerase IV [Gemmatimonadales bacterium]|nr:DNA polymerase IV [Gemmatimonadales bacterium]
MAHPRSHSRILLADCDQMFVAVARREDPDGAGKAPLLVVGGRANSRGVVCSASYEARAYGLRAGMPISRAVRLCPGATFVPVPGRACREAHRMIRDVLHRWAPVVQAASVDEFYLDLSGTERLYRDEPLAETSRRIREAVRDATGLTVSIGGGTNRLIAKMAAEQAKPRPDAEPVGVLIVPPGAEAEFMSGRRLAEIPGVGPRLQASLERRGLTEVRQALRVDRATLRQWLGAGTADWLYRRLRGQARDEVEVNPENRSMSREQTFPQDITDDEAIRTRLLRLVRILTAELRAEGVFTRCVTVKLRDHDFRTRQAGRTLPEPLSTDRALFDVVRQLLGSLRRVRRVPARLVGVKFSSLVPGTHPLQLSFLPPPPSSGQAVETARDLWLAGAVDAITRKLGEEAIGPARLVRPRSGAPRSP